MRQAQKSGDLDKIDRMIKKVADYQIRYNSWQAEHGYNTDLGDVSSGLSHDLK